MSHKCHLCDLELKNCICCTESESAQSDLVANDPINHPKHYNFGKYEVIDVIEDWELNYHRGNCLKYLMRAGKKNPEKEAEDLRKAIWYLERELKRLSEKGNK